MTREKSLAGITDPDLRRALQSAWDAFEAAGCPDTLETEKHEQRADGGAERRRQAIARLTNSGVPLVAAEVLVHGPVFDTEALGCVKNQIRRKPLLVLAGNTGCGKTVAGCYSLQTARGRLITAGELADLNPRHFRDREKLESLEKIAVLVVDDVGTEYPGDGTGFLNLFDRLLGKRAGNKLRTVLTTNLTSDEFRRRYEDRLWSRVCGQGGYAELDDPDMRVVRLPSRKAF